MNRYIVTFLCAAISCVAAAEPQHSIEKPESDVESLVAAQVRVEGRLTAWPASGDNSSTSLEGLLSSQATVDAVRELMKIEKPSLKVEAAVVSGVRWLEQTAMGGVAPEQVTDDTGKAVELKLTPSPKVDSWAGFYEASSSRAAFPEGRTDLNAFNSAAQELIMREYPDWRRRLALASEAPVLYLVGDSTLADKPRSTFPERGWGQMLRDFAVPPLRVDNHAMNGRSTKSFIDEGRWDEVLRRLKPDDWVLIEFGHNDSKAHKPAVYAEAQTDYRQNLLRMVAEVRAKGAHPLLASSVARRKWNEAHDQLVPTHGDYPTVAREVAMQEDVPFLELEALTTEMEFEEGYEGSTSLHVWIEPGENPVDLQGRQDNTHYSAKGGIKVARLAIREFHRLGLPFAALFSEDAVDLDELSSR